MNKQLLKTSGADVLSCHMSFRKLIPPFTLTEQVPIFWRKEYIVAEST